MWHYSGKSYSFGNEGRLFEVLLYIFARLHHPGGKASVWWHCMHKDTHTHTFECHCTHPHHEWHTCQQPSCAADLKQLPSQALSTLGSGELTAARGQALMLPPPSPSYHTERICWLTKCDYPQPFIMLLVRRVAGRNIWRNQLILSYLGNHGFCFRTTAVQFSATHKPFIPHWQHINTASICWI